MEIKDTRMKEPVFFETIKKGEVFMQEGMTFMRIRDCMFMDTLCNAIDVSNGDIFVFGNTDRVEKLNAEIVIH